MNILETLNKDMIIAMREKDDCRLSIIRIIKAELSTNSKAAKPRTEIEVFKSIAKKVNEEIILYTQVKQEDKVKTLSKQLEYINTFLPSPLTKDEIIVLLDQYDTDTYSMPALMGYLKNVFGDRFDGKLANLVIKEYINGKKS